MDKVELETIEFVNKGDADFDTKKQPVNASNLNQMQTNTNNALSNIQDNIDNKLNDINTSIESLNKEVETNTTNTSINTTNIENNLNAINGLKGKILWTNPNSASEFEIQNITLSSDDYDMYEVLAIQNLSSNRIISSGIIPKGYGSVLNYTVSGRYRAFDYEDNNLSFQSAHNTTTIDNSQLIPLYVIGYKTRLFEEVSE